MKKLIFILVLVLLATSAQAITVRDVLVQNDLTVKYGASTKLFVDGSASTLAWVTNKFTLDGSGNGLFAGTLTATGNCIFNGGATAIGVTASSSAAGKAIGITCGAGNGGTTTGYAGGLFAATSGAGSAGTTTGGAGGASGLTAGAGGTTTTGTSGAGGAVTITAGAAGAASGAGTSGAAGAVTITAGASGATAAGTGAAGGAVNITAGASGANPSGTSAAGGAVNITAGNAGAASGGTVGTGGAVNIYTGTGTANGAITVKTGGSSGTLVMTASGAGQVALCRGLKYVPIIGATLTTSSNGQNSTWTAAQLLGGFCVHDGDTGNGTATTCTGAQLSAAVTGVATGDSFTCVMYAKDNQATVTAGDGNITVVGTAAIPAGKCGTLHFICTGTNTWSCYVVVSA